MKGKVIDETFPKELLRYKILLKEIRGDLAITLLEMSEATKCSVAAIAHYIWLPTVGGSRRQKSFPSKDSHDAIVRFYSAEASQHENKDDIEKKIAEIDKLYQEFVMPELEDRAKNSINGNKAAAVRRLGRFKPKTELTEIILRQMQDCNVIPRHIFNFISGEIKVDDIFDALDRVNYCRDKFSSVARERLDKIINYEPLGFSEDKKKLLTELFYINCWNSICPEGLAEKAPVETYKVFLTVLMLQSGTSETELGGVIGISIRERCRQFISFEPEFLNELPNKEQHMSICDFFR